MELALDALPELTALVEAARLASEGLDFYIEVRPQPDGAFDLRPAAAALRMTLAALTAKLTP
jgi:hypothetical protein